MLRILNGRFPVEELHVNKKDFTKTVDQSYKEREIIFFMEERRPEFCLSK